MFVSTIKKGGLGGAYDSKIAESGGQMIRNVSAVENTIKPQIDTTRTANLNFETLNTHSSRKEINHERNIKIKSGEGFPSHQPS